MNDIKILEISCPLVDGSKLPFYEMQNDNESFDITPVINFISSLDISGNGKIDVGRNTNFLIMTLLGTDDLGAPPDLLYIKFKSKDLVYNVSVPFCNKTYINITSTRIKG